MQTNLLSAEEFSHTFKAPMRDITATAEVQLDIWPYVDVVPTTDLEGFVVSDGIVRYVYRSLDEAFEHILIDTQTADVFLVIVIKIHLPEIYGHHLLNLPKQYGLV